MCVVAAFFVLPTYLLHALSRGCEGGAHARENVSFLRDYYSLLLRRVYIYTSSMYFFFFFCGLSVGMPLKTRDESAACLCLLILLRRYFFVRSRCRSFRPVVRGWLPPARLRHTLRRRSGFLAVFEPIGTILPPRC